MTGTSAPPSYTPSVHYASPLPRKEQEPLLGPRNSRSSKTRKRSIPYYGTIIASAIIVLVVLSGFLGILMDRFINDMLDPSTRNNIRNNWDVERRNHERLMDDMHTKWNTELRLHRTKVEEYRREEKQWEETKEARNRKEKNDRDMARLYWYPVHGRSECASYGARWYSSELRNLRPGMDAIAGCQETSIKIHDVTYERPTHCESRRDGGVNGHWFIESGEAICSPYWEQYRDKGCLSVGFRRVEARLGGLRPQDDAETMCFSTPADIAGQHFDRPLSCPFWGINGFNDIWNVPDVNCR